MKTEDLELTATELLLRMNPNGDEDPGWRYGEGESYTEQDVIDLLQEKEDYIMSMLPEGYRRMIRSTKYHGEILTLRNKAGNKTFTPKLLPLVEDSVLVYVNYPTDLPFVHSEREMYSLRDSEYSVDYNTGVITIPSLNQYDRVYCTYDHAAGKNVRMLRRMCYDLAVVQLVVDNHLDVENYQVYRDMKVDVILDMKRMREKGDARLAIDSLDKVPTVVPLRAIGSKVTW